MHPAVGSAASPRKSAGVASMPRQVSSVLQGQLGAVPSANSAFAPPAQARAMDVYMAATQNPASGAVQGSYTGPAGNPNTATQNQAVAVQRTRSPLSAHRGLSPVVVSRQHAVQRQYSPIR